MSESDDRDWPGWARDAVEPVLSDLQEPHPLQVEVPFKEGKRPHVGAVSIVDAGGSATSFGISSEVIAGSQVESAYSLQEHFVWESLAASGEPRPQCPGHRHPTAAERIGEEAWWVCSHDEHRVSPIGRMSYGSAGAAPS